MGIKCTMILVNAGKLPENFLKTNVGKQLI